MPAIRPAPEDTSFNTPDLAPTDLGDYSKNLAYDALYHSPVAAVNRFSEGEFAAHDDTSKLLSPAEATKTYGLNGMLTFDEPTRESFASLLQERKLSEYRREYEIESGAQNSWGRKVSGFGVSMVSSLVDPVNLASMFFGVGEARYLEGAQRSIGLLNRGLISPKTIMGITGNNPLRFNLLKGAVNGTLGTAVVQPFDLAANIQEQDKDAWSESLNNIAAGGVLGAGFHAGGAILGEMFRNFSKGVPELDPQTHEAAIRGAVSDLVQDKPISAPSQILSVDHNVIQNELQEVNMQNLVTIAEEHLSRLEQLKEQGSITPSQELRRNMIGKMLENPTSATPENLASMFELKLNDDVQKMPDAYKFAQGFDKSEVRESVQFNSANFGNKIEELNKLSSDFYEKYGSDDYLPSERLTQDKKSFSEIAQMLAQHGYDILGKDVQLAMGKDAVVFLTKDKAIKLTEQQNEGKFPGISLQKEFTSEKNGWHIYVTDRVKPLGNEVDTKNISLAMRILAHSYGLNLSDLHAGNLGVDSRGNLRLIDEGSIEGSPNEKASPSPSSGKFIWNSLPKHEKAGVDKSTIMAIYQQLLKQIQDFKNNTETSSLQKLQEIQKQKQNEEATSSQKTVDKTTKSVQNPNLEHVKENRTPEEPINQETISHDTQNLKSEVSDLQKTLPDFEIKDDGERVKSFKQAIKDATNCISSKAV